MSRSALSAVPVLVGTLLATRGGSEPDRDDATRVQADRHVAVVEVVRDKRRQLAGAGFLYGRERFLVTSWRAVSRADAVRVALHGDRVHDAVSVGHDALTDVAVFAIPALAKGDAPYAPPAAMDLRDGTLVHFVGAPEGSRSERSLARTVRDTGRNVGTIAPTWRDFARVEGTLPPEHVGGPVLNSNGRLVGLATSMPASRDGAPSGSGFFLRADTLAELWPHLLKGGAFGRAWLGVRMREPATGDAVAGPLADVTIVSIAEDGPAARGGLEKGDVIERIDDSLVARSSDVISAVASRSPGDVVRLAIRRSGASMLLPVVLGRGADEVSSLVPILDDAPAPLPWYGFSLRGGASGGRGNLSIREIEVGSPADRSGLQPGDEIVSLNGARVGSTGEAQAILASKRPLLISLLRRGKPKSLRVAAD